MLMEFLVVVNYSSLCAVRHWIGRQRWPSIYQSDVEQLFRGRKVPRASADEGLPLWQDHVFMILQKNAANPTDYCRLPPNRVIELGMQVTI